MSASVHPNRSPLLISPKVLPVSDDRLGPGIFVFPNPELQGPTINMWKVVWLALMFQKIHPRHVKAFGVASRRIIQRNAGEVALHVAGNTIGLVFVISAGPLSRKVHLC